MLYNIVGYGSLISHKSLKETIKDKKFTPVIVKGYKRIFNLKIENDTDPDMLNVMKHPGSTFNGVLFKVNEKELDQIKERESEYNLEKTKCYDFKTKKYIDKCFVVADYNVSLDKKGFLPDKSYFILCREAAYMISEEFGKYWDNSTFTAKNQKISEWILKNPKYSILKNKT